MAKKIINSTQGIEVYRFLKKKNEIEFKKVKESLDDFYRMYNVSFDANEGILNTLRVYLGSRLNEIILNSDNQSLIKRSLNFVSNQILRKNKLDISSRVSAIQNVFENEQSNQDLLNYYVEENARLIKGVEGDKVEKMKTIILNSIQSGQNKSLITKALRGLVDRSNNRYKFIVRDQSAKLYSSITEVRAKTNNWDFYVWEDSNDVKVRSLSNTNGYQSHKMLDGKIYRFSEKARDVFKGKGAQFHNPGMNYGCRCTARVLFDPPEAFKRNSDGSYSYKKEYKRTA
jgi:SPP1 gp7 family putative phage head morphogenesis protein